MRVKWSKSLDSDRDPSQTSNSLIHWNCSNGHMTKSVVAGSREILDSLVRTKNTPPRHKMLKAKSPQTETVSEVKGSASATSQDSPRFSNLFGLLRTTSSNSSNSSNISRPSGQETRRSSADFANPRLFMTDSKRRRRASLLLSKNSAMRRSWQALSSPTIYRKNVIVISSRPPSPGSNMSRPNSSLRVSPISWTPDVMVSSSECSNNSQANVRRRDRVSQESADNEQNSTLVMMCAPMESLDEEAELSDQEQETETRPERPLSTSPESGIDVTPDLKVSTQSQADTSSSDSDQIAAIDLPPPPPLLSRNVQSRTSLRTKKRHVVKNNENILAMSMANSHVIAKSIDNECEVTVVDEPEQLVVTYKNIGSGQLGPLGQISGNDIIRVTVKKSHVPDLVSVERSGHELAICGAGPLHSPGANSNSSSSDGSGSGSGSGSAIQGILVRDGRRARSLSAGRQRTSSKVHFAEVKEGGLKLPTSTDPTPLKECKDLKGDWSASPSTASRLVSETSDTCLSSSSAQSDHKVVSTLRKSSRRQVTTTSRRTVIEERKSIVSAAAASQQSSPPINGTCIRTAV